MTLQVLSSWTAIGAIYTGVRSVPPRPSSPSLHVLTITPFFPYESNPVYGNYISEPIQLFGEYNLQSTVIGVSPIHHPRRRPLAGVDATWMRYPQIPGNLGLANAGSFLYRRLSSHVRRLHRENPIDVIHAHAALPCGHAASLLAQSLHVPFVVTVHGLDVFNSCFEIGTAAAKWRAKVSANVYRQAASVIRISKAVETILKNGVQFPVSSCVIYNGTDPEMFSPNDDTRTGVPTVLMVGNLLKLKGHEVVLRAMAQVSDRFPDLRCKIIGEGPDERFFASMARDLGMSGRVIFMGRQNRQAVAQAMRECTIFALPSRFEGLGCVYLEAMACAKPVVACEGQGIAEIIRHQQNGWLIPAGDVQKMSEALGELLTSADVRASIGANARRTVLEGLTLQDQVRRLDDLYRVVAKQ
jgi:teichuronic acid biosynthesis glycosyltransferase TuaC